MVAKYLVIGLILAIPRLIAAEEVFKWEDEDGVVHYTSKEPFSGAKPAELPPIMRGEVKVPKVAGESCASHGRINCSAGADSDGSVICADGYAASPARFLFSCNSPKLGIMQVSDPADDGSVTVVVRNSKSVAADRPELVYRSAEGKEIKVSGPEKIDSFGVVEFKLSGDFIEKPRIEELSIVCTNCP